MVPLCTHTHRVYIIYCISYLLLNIINCPQTWWLKTIKFIIPQFLWTRNWMRLSWVLLILCLSQGFNQTMGGGCSLIRRKSTAEDPFPAPSHGCWQDPFPLKDCGPSTSLSFLPCEPLHKVPHNMVGDLHQRGEHKSHRRQKPWSLYNRISEVISHHFYCIPCIGRQSPSLAPHTQMYRITVVYVDIKLFLL